VSSTLHTYARADNQAKDLDPMMREVLNSEKQRLMIFNRESPFGYACDRADEQVSLSVECGMVACVMHRLSGACCGVSPKGFRIFS
jgi:hypothetical protein